MQTVYLIFLRVIVLLTLPLTVLGFVGTLLVQRVWVGMMAYQDWAEGVDEFLNEEELR